MLPCHFFYLLLLLAAGDLVASSGLSYSNATLPSVRESSNTSLRYTQDDLEDRLEDHLERRWYSIREHRTGQSALGPPLPGDNVVGGESFRWTWTLEPTRRVTPSSRARHKLVEYCYVDEASRASLEELVADALEKWSDAFPACDNELGVGVYWWRGLSHEICKPLNSFGPTPAWVVRIQDCTAQNCKFDASLGMLHANNFINVNTNAFNRWYEQEPQRRAAVVLELARKWGNVFGLRGEHHRPDARQFVEFNCLYLQPWDVTDQRLRSIFFDDKDNTKYLSWFFPSAPFIPGQAHNNAWFANRLQYICGNTDPALTRLYFPEVLDYLPDPASQWMKSDRRVFDFNSIMIAPSYIGSMERWMYPAISRLQINGRVPAPWANPPEFWIFPGGTDNPANARPSALDVARLKELYQRRHGRAMPGA